MTKSVSSSHSGRRAKGLRRFRSQVKTRSTQKETRTTDLSSFVLCKATAGELRAALQELYLNGALPTPVIHATNADIGSILSGGLIPGGPQGSRDMVHFATEFPDSTPLRVLREEQAGPVGDTAAPVARRITEALPGLRKNCRYYIYLDLYKWL